MVVLTWFFCLKEDFICFPLTEAPQTLSSLNLVSGKPIIMSFDENLFNCFTTSCFQLQKLSPFYHLQMTHPSFKWSDWKELLFISSHIPWARTIYIPMSLASGVSLRNPEKLGSFLMIKRMIIFYFTHLGNKLINMFLWTNLETFFFANFLTFFFANFLLLFLTLVATRHSIVECPSLVQMKHKSIVVKIYLWNPRFVFLYWTLPLKLFIIQKWKQVHI